MLSPREGSCVAVAEGPPEPETPAVCGGATPETGTPTRSVSPSSARSGDGDVDAEPDGEGSGNCERRLKAGVEGAAEDGRRTDGRDGTTAALTSADAGGGAAGGAVAETPGLRSRGKGQAPIPPANPDSNGGSIFASNSFSDRRIIEVLAAPEDTHSRLLEVARCVPELLSSDGDESLATYVELYGSLAMDMREPEKDARHRKWTQDWPSHYANARSDVDFVVEMRPGVAPAAVLGVLVKKGNWQMIGQNHVHKFSSTQYTLQNRNAVALDVTCIESKLHFSRFKKRQEAFRKVFLSVRARMEAEYAVQGVLAFDAYIHLLKAFAAKVPEHALTGFQATCIGLFTLQIGFFRLTPNQSIALSLLEGFLRFCLAFFCDGPWMSSNYRQYSIDLCNGGRWLPRLNACWRSEMYFMGVEDEMKTRPDERVNVAHSIQPERVAGEARLLLERAFAGSWENAAPFMHHPKHHK